MKLAFLRNPRTVQAAGFLALSASSLFAQQYTVTNLVSSSNAATANAVNMWGLARSSTSPWWVADNGTGLSTLYDGSGNPQSLIVTIPGGQPGTTGSPTGAIYNGTTAFQVGPNAPAVFLFCTEDGTISGWNPGVNSKSAVIEVNNPNAVYKGMTAVNINGAEFLFVTNFASGHIEEYDANFNWVPLPRGAFSLEVPISNGFSSGGFFRFPDGFKQVPPGIVPFNIQNIGGLLYVSYAVQDAAHHDNLAGPGLGAVASFTPDGTLVQFFQYGTYFNAPWGMTEAPSDFGSFSHAVLVGNFGSGEILAFNGATGKYLGTLADQNANTIAIDGLWGLSFGNGGKAGPLNSLYFSAGPDGENAGLFGSIVPVASTQVMGNDQ